MRDFQHARKEGGDGAQTAHKALDQGNVLANQLAICTRPIAIERLIFAQRVLSEGRTQILTASAEWGRGDLQWSNSQTWEYSIWTDRKHTYITQPLLSNRPDKTYSIVVACCWRQCAGAPPGADLREACPLLVRASARNATAKRDGLHMANANWAPCTPFKCNCPSAITFASAGKQRAARAAQCKHMDCITPT